MNTWTCSDIDFFYYAMRCHGLRTYISLRRQYAIQHLSVNEKTDGTTTAESQKIAQSQDKYIFRCLRLDLHILPLYRQSAEKWKETHDHYIALSDDWIAAARRISADWKLFSSSGNETDDTMSAIMVHGPRRNLAPYGYRAEAKSWREWVTICDCFWKPACFEVFVNCLSTGLLLLSKTANGKQWDGLLCCLRKHLPYLWHFLSTHQSPSIISTERESCNDKTGLDCCLTLKEDVCQNGVKYMMFRRDPMKVF